MLEVDEYDTEPVSFCYHHMNEGLPMEGQLKIFEFLHFLGFDVYCFSSLLNVLNFLGPLAPTGDIISICAWYVRGH